MNRSSGDAVQASTGVFPAPAGMNRLRRMVMPPSMRVPRARGDEPVDAISRPLQLRVFPAPAGMNRDQCAFGDRCR